MQETLLLAADEDEFAVCSWCGSDMIYKEWTDSHHCPECNNAYQAEALRYLKAHPQQAL